MEFSRQEYWREVPFHSPGIFPTQRSNPGLSNCKQILDYLSHQAANKSSLCFRWKYFLRLPRLFATQTSLQTVWGKSYPCSCSEDMQNTTDPKRIAFEQISFFKFFFFHRVFLPVKFPISLRRVTRYFSPFRDIIGTGT